MNILIGVAIGLLILMSLVTAHEFGHFLMARRNGVKVLEYGICFPPRAIAWVHQPQLDKKGNPILKKNGKPAYKWVKIPKEDWDKPQDHLIFSLNWLPIGGFCQMDGESDADTDVATFGAATFWQKTKILFGGVVTNWIIGIITFTILAWIGMPALLDNQFTIANDETVDYTPVEVTRVIENSPAERAGFQVGDKILSVNDKLVYNGYDEAFSSFAGEDVYYEILRKNPDNDEDKTLTLTAHLNEKDNEWGYLLGINMASNQVYRKYTWSAPIVGIGTTAQLTAKTFEGLGQMLWKVVKGAFSQLSFSSDTRDAGREAIAEAGDSVTGPVGIIGVIFPSVAKSGIRTTLSTFALISVSLACMNVLPIPALDGGRWFMIFLSRLKHKRLTKEYEERIVGRTMIGLLIFMAFITVLDVIRFF